MVSKVGFSYSDVKAMTKKERFSFLRFYTAEAESIKAAHEN